MTTGLIGRGLKIVGIDNISLDPQHGFKGVGLHEASMFAWFSGSNVFFLTLSGIYCI